MSVKRIDTTPPGLVVSHQNISARICAEQKLIQSEARLQAILDTAMVGIISTDDKGNIVAFNAEAESIFQYTPADVMGQSVNILIPLAMRGAHQRQIEDFAAGNVTQKAMSDWRHVNGQRRDGAFVPLMAGISKTNVGGKVTLTVIFRDMSATLVAEKELNALSQERERQMNEIARQGLLLKSVMDSVPDGIVIMQSTGENVFWNRGYLALTGLTEHTSTTKKVSKATMADLLTALTMQKDDIELFITGETRERECLTEDARILLVRQLSVGIGINLLWVTNITERRAQETERVALRERLLLSQRNDAIGTMAGTVAHDFNNLLTIIHGFAELGQSQLAVLNDLPTHLPTRDLQAKRVIQHIDEAATSVAKSLANIASGAQRGRAIVTGLTNFAKVAPSELANRDLAKTVSLAASLVLAALPSSISLVTVGLDQKFAVRHDRGRIEQALLNLCINSTHAIGDRTGTITLTLAREQIDGGRAKSLATIDAASSNHTLMAQETADGWTTLWRGILGVGDFVRIDVADTGSGISAEMMRRVFDPYFTTKPNGQGTGLGLLSVTRIVEEHQGATQVRSRLGAGTTFSLFLPLLSGTEIDTPIDEDEPELHRVVRTTVDEKLTILIVDDEVYLTELIELTLKNDGYLAEVRNNPEDALALFELNPLSFDLVITDQTMPSLLGTELASRIHKINPKVPILLCTGFSAKALDEKNLPTGIVHILKKPFTPGVLVATVAAILTRTE